MTILLGKNSARRLALHVLLECRKKQAFAQDLLDQSLRRTPLSPADRRLATQLIYGVLRRRGTLDALLRPRINRQPRQVEPWIWETLRLGAFQLLLLSHIPPHAALNETVELANSMNLPRAKGFINGVLRSILPLLTDEETRVSGPDALPLADGVYRKLGQAALPEPSGFPVEYLAHAFSLPGWLASRWHERFGWEECVRLGFWFAGPAPLTLRINTLRCARATFLRDAGDSAEAGAHSQAVRWHAHLPLTEIPGFAEGHFVVQDESAMQVAAALAPEPGQCVLDLCAAPGGKTSHLAELMGNQGQVLACDVDRRKLVLLEETCGRLGLTIVEAKVLDDRRDEAPSGPFDAVLVDVPCSNTGVLGKRPEVRWRLKPNDLRNLAPLQTRLLHQGCDRVRRGGKIVYSTCSIEPEENREVVQTVLAARTDFTLEAEEAAVAGHPADGGYWARFAAKFDRTGNMTKKKLYIETVGCQMNVLDSELVVGSLRRQGFEMTHEAEDADVILFNTCSVRQHAEDKIYSQLGRLRGHKRRHPETIIGVLGCMAQKDQELIRRRAPHVDIICGTGQLARLSELIAEVNKTGDLQVAVSLERTESRAEVERSFTSYDPLRNPSMRPSPFQAYVRIMIGCDKFCTYCIVPSVRGPEQSRPPEHIAAEVKQLADEGCKEITLLGQTVNSYKFPRGDGRVQRLSDLLALIHDAPGIERIKFITNFPRDMTDDLLQAVRDLPKVCSYLHVPAQSGCNEVLRRMKRQYTVEFYRDMLARCREIVPGVAVSSDFIVGFSGESEESFERSCSLVRDAGFKNSFIFKYSPRPGTKGHELFEDDVPEEVKKRRNNDLLAIQNAASLEDHVKFVGRRVQVLVEGLSKSALKQEGKGPTQLTGRTMSDHIVVFDGNQRLIGQTATVDIVEATSFTLFGEVVTDARIGVDRQVEKSDIKWGVAMTAGTRRIGLPLV